MKRFLLGVLAGIAVSAAPVAAQKMASDKVVLSALLFENQKVKITRTLLKTGEGTPLEIVSIELK